MTDLLERLKASLADRYRIERELGSGGMATVYLAHDLKHDRKVAIKVLRPELVAVLGAERFLNEINVTANLQHPHILPLHDSGEAESFLFYVMPFVDGESLRAKLDREKQLSIEESLEITKSVASALDYAHRHNVIHRDIKPENILLHDGQPVVADFGIALAVTAAGGTRLTETGLSLGTPQYMSPEQATGDREIDGRSDVYSLACVLYEMLAGDPPHTGSTVQAVIAKVVTDRPRPVRELRERVPVNLEAALDKALAKLPADRFDSAAKFVEAFERPIASVTEVATREQPLVLSGQRIFAAKWPSAIWPLLTVIAGAIAIWSLTRPGPLPSPPSHWTIDLPPEHRLAASTWDLPIAIAPDGSRLAYVTEFRGERQLWLRERSEFNARQVPNTAGASNPFFSPDGQWVGFFAHNTLYKTPVAGGNPIRVCDLAGMSFGAVWGADDTIIYSDLGQGLKTVSAAGGVAAALLPSTSPAHWYMWPQLLPGGNELLLTLQTEGGDRVAIVSLRERNTRILTMLGEATNARYLQTGDLIYLQAGVLQVVPFDAETFEPHGSPTALPLDIAALPGSGLFQLVVSDNGTLAYAPAMTAAAPLVWVDRLGNATQLAPDRADFHSPRLSPDGERLVVTAQSGGLFGLWDYQLARGGRRHLVGEGVGPNDGVWRPAGDRVTFAGLAHTDSAGRGILEMQVDGNAEFEVLVSDGHNNAPHSWSPDGRYLAYYRITEEAARDIWVLPRGGEPHPFIVTQFNERSPSFSPDGRWIAYVSDESGRDEIYVTAYPGPRDTRRISSEGGRVPVWSHDGRELFYRNGNQMFSVPVQLGEEFVAGEPQVLFEGMFYAEPGGNGSQDFDVTPDGQRFVMIQYEPPTQIRVILNWFEELHQAMER